MSEFPIITNDVVTEAHTEKCRVVGHASWKKDGVETGICPRCGVVKPADKLHGYKKEMTYRGYGIYYSARSNMTAALTPITLEIVASCEGSDGTIFRLVDEKLAMMGY